MNKPITEAVQDIQERAAELDHIDDLDQDQGAISACGDMPQ